MSETRFPRGEPAWIEIEPEWYDIRIAQLEAANAMLRFNEGRLKLESYGRGKEANRLADRLGAVQAENAKLQAQLAALQWTPIDEEHLPKVGDELLGHDFQCGWGVGTIDQTPESERDPMTLRRMGWKCFRPLNAPRSKP